MNNRRDNNYNSFSNRNNINNSNEGSLFFNKDCSDGTTDRKTLPKHRTVDYSNYWVHACVNMCMCVFAY